MKNQNSGHQTLNAARRRRAGDSSSIFNGSSLPPPGRADGRTFGAWFVPPKAAFPDSLPVRKVNDQIPSQINPALDCRTFTCTSNKDFLKVTPNPTFSLSNLAGHHWHGNQSKDGTSERWFLTFPGLRPTGDLRLPSIRFPWTFFFAFPARSWRQQETHRHYRRGRA